VSTQSDEPVEVPEADRLEQQTPLEQEPVDPEATTSEPTTTDEIEANEADLLEQRAAVSGDEDYPRGEQEEE
jgi:hypothetical protein